MSISTHVLDTSQGRPAAHVPVVLQVYLGEGDFKEVQFGETDHDGRIGNLMPEDVQIEGLQPGQPITLRLTFDTGAYFEKQGVKGFYPYVSIIFNVDALTEHYHVPLLVSPFGYSTYRGS